MLSLYKSPRFSDPQLGMLERSRGLWRGSTALYPSVIVSLALAGTRTETKGLRFIYRQSPAALSSTVGWVHSPTNGPARVPPSHEL